MKKIRVILLVSIILVFMSGCGASMNLDVVHKSENNEDFELYVNKVEKKLQQCFEYKKKSSLEFKLNRYLIREDYHEPRYVKLKLIYNGMKAQNLNVLYIFKEDKGNKIVVRDVRNSSSLFAKFKPFMENGMECKNDEI